MPIERVDPPVAGDEVTTLRTYVAFYRATLVRQCEGLSAEQLTRTLPPTTMTLGGMLKHLAFVEHWWLGSLMAGGPWVHPRWPEADFTTDPDWEWHSAADDTPEELRAWFAEVVGESDRIIDDALAIGGLEQQTLKERHGERPSLRWILVHLIEEYARHCGHADLIRESIDGAVDL